MKIERLKRMVMSTTKMHYDGYLCCGPAALSDNVLKTWYIEDIDCQACLKRLLGKIQNEVAEAQRQHERISRRYYEIIS